jgi:hypothetical protein
MLFYLVRDRDKIDPYYHDHKEKTHPEHHALRGEECCEEQDHKRDQVKKYPCPKPRYFHTHLLFTNHIIKYPTDLLRKYQIRSGEKFTKPRNGDVIYSFQAAPNLFVIVFIGNIVIVYVESGDILTLVAGLVIVIIIAVIANPHSLSTLQNPMTFVSSRLNPTPVPTPTPQIIYIMVTPTPPPPPLPPAPPYRIFYTSNPLSYPVFRLPENMETFGASEIPMRTKDMVTFAYVEDTRGGLTQPFSVPYPVWIINTTVVSEINPQYGRFRMVLCYANNGTIIEGEEILNRGTVYRVVQTSNTDL